MTATYDAWNRLTEVKEGAVTVAKYEYDGRNRRIKKHLDSQSPASPNGIDSYVHYFYNSAWQVLETRHTTSESAQAESLQPEYQYVWSRRYIDAAVLRDKNTDQDSTCDDQRLYYLNDANFNVVALADTAGDVQERYSYDAYGKVTIYDATWSNIRNTSSYNVEYLFTGRRLDTESGLMYYRNRYYHAQLGRFINRDPIGYAGGMHLYRAYFVPMSTDPFGMDDVRYEGNDAYYQDEGFLGWDYAGGKYHIGKKTGNRIVFDQRFGLPDTSVAKVERCGSADNFEDFLNCVKAIHGLARYYYVVEECQIVLVYGHGGPTGHVFVPQNNSTSSDVAKYWAAGFVGCYSKVTNEKIPKEHRSYNLPMASGRITTRDPDWSKASLKRMHDGATRKAKELCSQSKKGGGCCKEIEIAWRVAPSLDNPIEDLALPSPSPGSWNVGCE